MALELMPIVLTKATEWAVGKALDVATSCLVSQCRERFSERIENGQTNTLICPNCHKEHAQFTRACETTVGPDGTIGHVALIFDSSTWMTEWFERVGRTVSGRYRFQGLKNTQLREVNSLVNLDDSRETVILDDRTIWKPKANDDTRKMWINCRFKKAPRHLKDGRVVALDARIETRFGEQLLYDRYLTKL